MTRRLTPAQIQAATSWWSQTEQLRIDAANASSFAELPITDPYVDPGAAFMGQTMDFNGSTHQLDLGAAVGASWSNCTISYWFRLNSTSWSANLVHLARNASSQRQFTITQQARGSNGELAIGFSSGTTMINAYVPDNTFQGPWWHHVVVVKSGSTVTFYADGIAVALQNPSGTYPASVGTSTAPVRIGATGASGSPASFYLGKMCNVAMWTGFAASAAEAQALWGSGYGAVDYRTAIATQPTWYVPGNVSPAVELIVPITVGGTQPSTYSTTLPPIRVFNDAIFSHRFMINESSEPWFSTNLYSATPAAQKLDDDRLIWAYSRGSGHIVGHSGYYSYSDDDGQTFPISGGAYPLDTDATVEATIPHGDLTASDSSKRSMTLTRIAEIGTHGRLFIVFNETDWTLPSFSTSAASISSNVATATVASHTCTAGDWIYTTGLTVNAGDSTNAVQVTTVDSTHISYPCTGSNGAMADGVGTVFKANPGRRIWIMYSDDNGSTWTSPYEFVGGGYQTTASRKMSVGRGRIVRRTDDGSLIFGYYRNSFAEAAYDACLARSTDNGATWAYYTTIASSTNRSSGCQFEEPYIQYVPGQGLRCQLRVDSGQDPRIEGNAALNGVILVTVSSDHGVTWPVPTKVYDGRHHPLFIYRPYDGRMFALHGHVDDPFAPRLRISNDLGVTWTDEQAILTGGGWTSEALNMQGDFYITEDNRVLLLFAQEKDGVSATRMWGGILREDWIRTTAGPI